MTKNKVLIISHPQDEHADIVSQWLAKENLAEPILFDFHDFPVQSKIIYEGGSSFRIRLPGRDEIKEEEILSVWWRRPQGFSFAETINDPEIERFCDLNCSHAIYGLLSILGERVIDPPSRLIEADRKTYQLHIAQSCGLKTPRTCITNDPESARQFVSDTNGSVICKIFRGTEKHYSSTLMIHSEDLEKLHLIRHSPIIFQQYIELGYDVRITVIRDSVFAAKLTSEKKEAIVDIRKDFLCNTEAYDLPKTVEKQILRVMKTLGLRFSTIDMRVDPKGEHYFLEVNPAGQYLYVEMLTNQPMTASLAQLLARPFD